MLIKYTAKFFYTLCNGKYLSEEFHNKHNV